MDRAQADHQLWQYKPFSVQVKADAYLGVEPHGVDGVTVTQNSLGWCIEGAYGVDCFPKHRFTVLIGTEQLHFERFEDIPDQFDNLIDFSPDETHDVTFSYRFKRSGELLVHRHWVHHDMTPWTNKIQVLIARETNGGWNAISHKSRGRRHRPLLRNGPRNGLARRLLQWKAHLTPD
jgi:hypothetical protein